MGALGWAHSQGSCSQDRLAGLTVHAGQAGSARRAGSAGGLAVQDRLAVQPGVSARSGGWQCAGQAGSAGRAGSAGGGVGRQCTGGSAAVLEAQAGSERRRQRGVARPRGPGRGRYLSRKLETRCVLREQRQRCCMPNVALFVFQKQNWGVNETNARRRPSPRLAPQSPLAGPRSPPPVFPLALFMFRLGTRVARLGTAAATRATDSEPGAATRQGDTDTRDAPR